LRMQSVKALPRGGTFSVLRREAFRLHGFVSHCQLPPCVHLRIL
jgi:hypothetical protein